MRPSTAEEDVYLEELMGKILSEREDSLLKLTQVVHDIEERLKWEQAANEARWEMDGWLNLANLMHLIAGLKTSSI